MGHKITTTDLHVECKASNNQIGVLHIDMSVRMNAGIISSERDPEDPRSKAAEKYIHDMKVWDNGLEKGVITQVQADVGKKETLRAYTETCLKIGEVKEQERRVSVAKEDGPVIYQFLKEHLPDETYACLAFLFRSEGT